MKDSKRIFLFQNGKRKDQTSQTNGKQLEQVLVCVINGELNLVL